MGNFMFVKCKADTIRKLISVSTKKHKILQESNYEVTQYIVIGFDYMLEYGRDHTRFLRTNLSNWDFIVFDVPNVPKGSDNDRINVKLLRGVFGLDSININDEQRYLIMKIDELLNDNQDLTDQINNLRDDLSNRDRHIDKLKSRLEWQKVMFDVIQDMYASLLGESKKETKGDN